MFLRLALTLALAACHAAPCDAAADGGADIRGRVTHVRPADDAGRRRDYLGSILVEGEGRYDKVNVAVRRGTVLLRLSENRRRPARFDDLRVGARVRVWFDGPVSESYPAQATAREIVIVGDEERGGSSRPNVPPRRAWRNTPRAAFEVFRRGWGDRPNPPRITLLFVSGLAHPDYLMEIDAVAVVPQDAG